MTLFPTIWEILIPNWNLWTVLGTVMIVLSILAYILANMLSGLKPIADAIRKGAGITMLAAIILIIGVSILEDLLKSQGVQLIVVGIVVIGLVAYFLFGRGKK